MGKKLQQKLIVETLEGLKKTENPHLEIIIFILSLHPYVELLSNVYQKIDNSSIAEKLLEKDFIPSWS